MRIAQISTLARPVPPRGEGSVETLVSILTEGLVERGHEVTLYALPGSQTAARLRSPVQTSYRDDPTLWDWQLYEALNVREAFREFRDFDLIHCHAYHHGLMFCDFVPTPSLHSMHVEPGPDILRLAQVATNRHLLFASAWQAREFSALPGVHIVPHAVESIPGSVVDHGARRDYLVFLGRFMPEKGPLAAIEFAEAVGMKLKLAAPENAYFREAIRPLVDGDRVEYVGEVTGAEKHDLLAHAHALIYPIQTPEPFGLVLAEAMACGTPVLALDRGAVGEVVRVPECGILAETLEELVAVHKSRPPFDAAAIQAVARAQFSPEAMVGRVEAIMKSIVEKAGT